MPPHLYKQLTKLLTNMDFILFSPYQPKKAALDSPLFLLFIKNSIYSFIKPAFEGGYFRINAGRYDART
jgi:hypothetical protein